MPEPWIVDTPFLRRPQRHLRWSAAGARSLPPACGTALQSRLAQASQDAQQDAYWHDHYHLEPYYVNGRGYDQYRPAYQLGWRAVALHPGEMAAVMPVLEAQWRRHSGASLLDWRQVASAVRAGWEHMGQAEPKPVLSSLQQLVMLQRLQRMNLQTARGLRLAVAQTPRGLLQQMLQRHLQAFETSAHELAHSFTLPAQDRLGRLLSESLLRGWESVKAMLGPQSLESLLDDSEADERMLLAAYHAALREILPEAVRTLLQRQAMAVQRGIEALHWLRS